MRVSHLPRLGLRFGLPLVFFVAACGSASTRSGSDGTGGDMGSGSGTGGGDGSGTGGATGSGGNVGNHGTGGSPSGTGGQAMPSGTGGLSGSGGGLATGTGGMTSGSGGGPGSGGRTGTGGGAGPGTGGTGGVTTGTGGGPAGTGGAGGTTVSSVSGLPVPPGPANVPQPSGTPGNITVLNWAGFKSAVTYSFDDDNDSQISNYSMLQAAGGQYTFFLWTNRSQATNAIWKQALKDGHEIGNHTKSHDSTNACTSADMSAASDFIMSTFGIPAQTFAAPNGSQCYKTFAQNMFFIDRSTGPASPVMPNGNSDPLSLNCYIPAMGQQASVFKNDIDSGHTAGGWVIYVVHGFSMTDGSYQPVDIGQMTTAIKYAKSLPDMWVGSMVNVGAYWLGQKSFSSAMTATAGTDKTWTWTLPAHFPPGHYLRVTVAGGTLKQNGTALPWDPHGYYEIALDAKSVTLSP